MDVNENNYISVEDDIKQIAQDLLRESKTLKIIRIHYFDDKTDSEPCVLYRRFESVPQMQEMGLLEIIKPIECNAYPRNFWEGDLNIIQNPIYKVKINSIKLAKFILNPDIEPYLKKEAVPTVCKLEDLLIQYVKLSIIKKTENTVYLFYEELKPSDPISKKSAWFKVFYDFVENKRLEKQDIMAVWNTAGKSKFKNTKKTRDNTSYVTTIRRQILDGLNCASPEIAKHVKIVKGTGYYKNSYNLEVN